MSTENWKPKTELGKLVLDGKVATLDEVFASGRKIKEPQIVDKLLPNLQSDIIFIGGTPGKGGGIRRTSTRRTVRMHRSGRRFRISALVVVGSPGYLGVGKAASNELRLAGVKDVWTDIKGSTRTRYNYVMAIFDAFKNLNKTRVELHKAREVGE